MITWTQTSANWWIASNEGWSIHRVFGTDEYELMRGIGSRALIRKVKMLPSLGEAQSLAQSLQDALDDVTRRITTRRTVLHIGIGSTPLYADLEDAYIDLDARSDRIIQIATTHQDDPQWLEVLELLSPAPVPKSESQMGFFELMRDQFGFTGHGEVSEQS